MSMDMTPPIPLTGKALDKWRELWPRLFVEGYADDRQADQIALYCQAFADFVEANERLEQSGKLVKDSRNRVVVSPWLALRNQASDEMRRLADVIGLRTDDQRRARLRDYFEHVAEEDEEEPHGAPGSLH